MATDGDHTIEPERRAALNRAMLGALVREHWGVEAKDLGTIGTGASVVADGVAYILLEGTAGGLGAALALAWRDGASTVRIVVNDDSGGELARHASFFSTPIEVWRVKNRGVVPVPPAPRDGSAPPPDAPDLVAHLLAQGLDVVVEGDHLAGEWNGLEVARILRDEEGVPGLSVGVGRFDRELTALVHGELTPSDALARVTEQVALVRRADAPVHPLRTLVPERWLRSRLVAEPAMIGCTELAPAPGPRVRDRLRTRGIGVAVGHRDGQAVVVATTVGAHLDAVPDAADARDALDPDATLLVVVPARDELPVTSRLVRDLRVSAELVTVADDWRG